MSTIYDVFDADDEWVVGFSCQDLAFSKAEEIKGCVHNRVEGPPTTRGNCLAYFRDEDEPKEFRRPIDFIEVNGIHLSGEMFLDHWTIDGAMGTLTVTFPVDSTSIHYRGGRRERSAG